MKRSRRASGRSSRHSVVRAGHGGMVRRGSCRDDEPRLLVGHSPASASSSSSSELPQTPLVFALVREQLTGRVKDVVAACSRQRGQQIARSTASQCTASGGRFSTVLSCNKTQVNASLIELLPPNRDPSVSLRLRHPTIYPFPQVRTNRYCSFMNHALQKYQ